MIGRTIANFQRLERNLKLAARLGPLRGTIPRIQSDIAKRHERASGLTLGQAIQAWLDFCCGQPVTHGETPDLFDVSMQMTFSLESDAKSRARHAKALRDLLRVRNDLIHSRLATFAWEDSEACGSLVSELERVNMSIAEQIEYTSALLKAIADLHKECVESIAATFEGEQS